MRAGGIEVCLADRAAVHQKLGFAIKRNAHLCLSLQVTRKDDDGPCISVGWGWQCCGDEGREYCRSVLRFISSFIEVSDIKQGCIP